MAITPTPGRRDTAPPTGKQFPLDKAIAQLRDFRRMEVSFEKRHGISLQQVAILESVKTLGRASIGDLVVFDRNAWTGVSKCIRVLVAKGLVVRSGIPDDIRVHLVELTPEGSELLERIRAADAHV